MRTLSKKKKNHKYLSHQTSAFTTRLFTNLPRPKPLKSLKYNMPAHFGVFNISESTGCERDIICTDGPTPLIIRCPEGAPARLYEVVLNASTIGLSNNGPKVCNEGDESNSSNDTSTDFRKFLKVPIWRTLMTMAFWRCWQEMPRDWDPIPRRL